MNNSTEFNENTVKGSVGNLSYISNAILTAYILNDDKCTLFKLKMNNIVYLVLHEIKKCLLIKDAQGNCIYYIGTFLDYIKENNKGEVELISIADDKLKEEMLAILDAYKLIHNTQ